MQLSERIELHSATPEGPFELDLEPMEPMDWSEGVEELQDKDEHQLYEMLGFTDEKIPFLASHIEEDADIGALTYGDKPQDHVTSVTVRKPLRLKWHQLVGVVKLVACALHSNAVLLMDEVGMGKTLQVIAYFAVLAYYREFYDKTKRYPGTWGA